ncbi:ArsR/SmtB family transcription factor [Cellulomonas sp. NPDC057328]|uniref:ArsR/SmtB family transcription factor n=1 Tax=Cellulomonas sp. NPDC057328 TaxID=3346101 RepID=UPI003643D8A0
MAMTTTAGDARALDEVAGIGAAAGLFRALGDPSRLAILRHLLLGEHRVVDLTGHLGLAQSTVSKHLACLRGCGLVTCRAEGRASWFALTEPDAVVGLLAAAEHLLGRTGDAVTLCPAAGGGTSRPAGRGDAP